MLKKITALILSLSIALGATACGKKDTGNGEGVSLADSYASTMIVTPASVKLDKGFLEKYKDVKNVVLPEDYDKNLDKITDEIASFAENEKVKCIIICSDKEGLLPVFEKIKKKNDAVVTMAAGIEEIQNEEKQNDVIMNEDINIGFNPTDKDNNLNAIRMAESMGAKVFVNYVDEFAKQNVEFKDEMRSIERECDKAGLKYVQVDVPGMKNEEDSKTAAEFIKKDAVNKKKSYGEDVCLYGYRASMDRALIEAAIENRLMVPNIHSLDSTRLYCDILGIKTKEEDYNKINAQIAEKLKGLNMEGRLAGTDMPEKAFCVEIAVDTANKLFKKKVEENELLNDIKADIKEKTGIWAEYNKMKYYNHFLRTVEMYPILY